MQPEVRDDRIAILLRSLGDEIVSGVMKNVAPGRASSMMEAMARLEKDPPDDEEELEVLQEFQRFMEFALANSNVLFNADAVSDDEVGQRDSFVSTNDPFEDLKQLHDYQIAGALRNETGAAIAIVLGQLPTERVGEVMRQLPDSVKQDAFLRLQAGPKVPQSLLTRVIQATVERASRLDQNAASDPDHVADEKTAGLLRAMDRKTRTEMLAALEASQPDVAERVKGMLFLFEDLLKFTDKSVQKLLGEVETSQLAVALKNADDDIKSRITDNLSKRAKATLAEEMEYLDSVSSESEQEARKAMCDIFAQLDQRGDLEMINS